MAENVRIGLWISRKQLARLKADPRGISEAVRQSLDESFARDAMDPRTRQLEAAITELAGLVQYDAAGVAWHQHPETHGIFAEAVARLLAYMTSPMDMPATRSPDEMKKLDETLATGASLTNRADTPAKRAAQLFRVYLLQKHGTPDAGFISRQREATAAIRKHGRKRGKQ